MRFIVDSRGSSAQRPTRRNFSHGDTKPRRLIHRTEPKLRDSVSPCETLHLLVPCSKTHTTHRTEPKLRGSVSPCETLLLLVQCSKTHTTHRTEPKLRGSVSPCETLLLLVQCSKTRTTLLLTRRHGGSSTTQNPSSVTPCLRVKTCSC